MVKALLAGAQFDVELARVFLEKWTLPRRKLVYEMLQEATQEGDANASIDVETAIDLLYAPLYYRLQIGPGVISDEYVDRLFEQAMGRSAEWHNDLIVEESGASYRIHP